MGQVNVDRVVNQGWVHPDYDRCLDLIQQHGEAVDSRMHMDVSQDATLVWITNRFSAYRDVDEVQVGQNPDAEDIFNMMFFFVTGVELDGLIYLDVQTADQDLDDHVIPQDLDDQVIPQDLDDQAATQELGEQPPHLGTELSHHHSHDESNDDHLWCSSDVPPLLSSSPDPIGLATEIDYPTSSLTAVANTMETLSISEPTFQFPGLSLLDNSPVASESEFDINPYWSEEDSQISDDLGGFHFEDEWC